MRFAHAHNATWFNLDSGEGDRGTAIVCRAGMTGGGIIMVLRKMLS